MKKYKAKSGFSRTVHAFQWPNDYPLQDDAIFIKNMDRADLVDVICPRCMRSMHQHGELDRGELDPETASSKVSPLIVCPSDYLVKQEATDWFPVKPYVMKHYFKEIKE